jgi:hypothetical protein
MAKISMAKSRMAKDDEANTPTTTYRYRDAEKRRTYMRDLMRKRAELKRGALHDGG